MFGANIHRTSAISLSSLALERQRSDTCLARKSRKSLRRTTKSPKKCWWWLKSCTNKDVLKPLGNVTNYLSSAEELQRTWRYNHPRMFACLLACLLVCLFVFVFLFVCLFVWLVVCLFVCLFVCFCVFVRLFGWLFVCLFVRLFVCSFVRLFVCLLKYVQRGF